MSQTHFKTINAPYSHSPLTKSTSIRSGLMCPVFFGLLSKPYINSKGFLLNLEVKCTKNTHTFIPLKRKMSILHLDRLSQEISPRFVDHMPRSITKYNSSNYLNSKKTQEVIITTK